MLQRGVWALAVGFAVEHGEPAGMGEAPTLRDLADGGRGPIAAQQVLMGAM